MAVALSGGVDSMALLYLLRNHRPSDAIFAFTVDHGFRPESLEEAQKVQRIAQELDVDHRILTIPWQTEADMSHRGTPGPAAQPVFPRPGQMEEAGRTHRYQLMGQACRDLNIPVLFTGHHLGDRLETSLIRFLVSSGVDGIAGISATRPFRQAMSPSMPYAQVARPLLNFPKERLLATCQTHHIPWFEDPSNKSHLHNRNFLRTLIDQASAPPSSETEGAEYNSRAERRTFSAPVLLRLNRAMQERRKAAEAMELLLNNVRFRPNLGIAVIAVPHTDPAGRHPGDWQSTWWNNSALATRLYALVINWVYRSPYAPRLRQLEALRTHLSDYARRGALSSAAQEDEENRDRSANDDEADDDQGKPAALPTHLLMGRTMILPYVPPDPRRVRGRAIVPKPALADLWLVTRQPFQAGEVKHLQIPLPVTGPQGPLTPTLWAERFYLSASLQPEVPDPQTRLASMPALYIREFRVADWTNLRRQQRYYQNIAGPGAPQRPASRTILDIKQVPGHVRYTLPAVFVRHNDQEILIWFPAFQLYRNQPFVQSLRLQYRFARAPLSSDDQWQFQTLD
ncbi:hypothetical protein IWQ60_007533 [Tieghemiomyces parasiticus]|uniref:tRNA(Ile)-lysidine synthetase n=1 Tax=Tieghemiomyces parasiticus TaxID=78921 RepID=A0A9W7ZWX3_9FUNG|nr:hypothetical protein IWQ60_007533 [Tieghemiomyces parasiticus]